MAGRRRRAAVAGVALLVLGSSLTGCEPDPISSTLDRLVDPVVVTGAQANALVGAQPGRVVAFRASSAGWTQVPVQVDERKTTTLAAVYNLPPNQFGGTSTNVNVNVYTDPNTFTGADTDATVDADDEIVFMAHDAGGDAGNLAAPPGTVGGGVEVRIADPAVANSVGFVYLFRSDGSLAPGAGKQYVTYSFGLNSGDYKATYNRLDGPNPENSTITGQTYSAHFSDRWLLDRVSLSSGNKPGVDLVDRVMYRFPGTCGRTEDTFDDAEGAFVVNKVGPVRALRSYIGANSGPNTQATHAFYDSAMETTIDLRVHAIPGVGASLDLNQQAFGMTFRNPQVTGGVPIDGNPDTVPAGTPSWWTMTGAQGSLGFASSFQSNLALTPSVYYQDDLTPTNQCTGDGQAVADTGAFFNAAIACTDPGQGCSNTLRSRFRTIAGPPNNPALIQKLAQQGLQPLTVTTSAYP
jgi:hypothetical protein